MIELTFSEGTAGALKYAKSARGRTIGGTKTTFDDSGKILSEESYTLGPYNGPTLAGSAKDIICLWLMADIGDIQDIESFESRRLLLSEISRLHADELNRDDEYARSQLSAIERLKRQAAASEPIRIWWSDAPGETCGFYWAVHALKDYDCPVYSVRVPAFLPAENGCLSPSSTGDLTAETLATLAEGAEPMPRYERLGYASLWQKLVRENAPLRAVINGQARSVPIDFYDDALRQSIPASECKVAQIIGRTLAEGPTGVSDWWYALRIREFTENHELIIISNANQFYSSTVRKGAG